jgi:FtsP/CotA-like multicopper oxidase with cupredoxin domain
MTTTRLQAVLLSALSLLLPGAAAAQACPTVDLYAEPTTLTMADGTPIYAWGFGSTPGAATVPGPVLNVPAGCDPLEVRLHNGLQVPTSVILLGQAPPTDSSGALLPPRRIDLGPKSYPDYSAGNTSGEVLVSTQRASALTAEVPPGGTGSYFFRGLRAGTYLYESGSDLAVQVQMGLHGAAVIYDSTPVLPGLGRAYPGVPFTSELVLVLSEIDKAVHARVQAGDQGGTPVYGLAGVVGYRPSYFLVNGKSWPDASLQGVAAGASGDSLLIRVLNAGLQNRAPELIATTLPGAFPAPASGFTLVAEDGHPYPAPRHANAVLVPAGKTLDALLRLTGASYGITDRALGLGNGPGAGGGQQLTLGLAPAARAVVPDRSYVDDPSLPSFDVPASAGLLAGVTVPAGTTLEAALVTLPAGTIALSPDGSFSYTAPAGFVGWDRFAYKAIATGGAESNVATVSIQVPRSTQAPQAVDDGYVGYTTIGFAVSSPGVLGNDADVSGVGMTSRLRTDSSCAGDTVALNLDGSFIYFASPANGLVRTCTFTYDAVRSALPATYSTATVTVSLVQAGASAPVAVDDATSTTMNVATDVSVLLNDYSPDGRALAPPPTTGATGSMRIVSPPWGQGAFPPAGTPNGGKASAVIQPDGTIRFTPAYNFRGSDDFSYQVRDASGAWSNTATVRVNVR